MYRGAGRTLKYPVYLGLEIVWIGAASYLVFANLVSHDTSLHWIFEIAAISVAILHSVKMTMTLPWIFLKSILLGAAVFGLSWLVTYFTNAPFMPMALAVVVATAHYLYVGEVWANEMYRRQALLSAVAAYKKENSDR
jgi:hypothetical protein